MNPLKTGLQLAALVALCVLARRENNETPGNWLGSVALVIFSPMALALIQHAILRSPLFRVALSYRPLF